MSSLIEANGALFGTLLVFGQIGLFVLVLLLSLAFLLLMDRKVWAAVMMRKGPNVVGPFGLLQSFADFGKFLLKEIIIPAGANKTVFLLAPILRVFGPASLGAFAPGESSFESRHDAQHARFPGLVRGGTSAAAGGSASVLDLDVAEGGP